jgi:membrane-associated phospholipid phosphatase
MLLLAAYFLGVVTVSDLLNFRLGVELLTLTVLVAAALITRNLGLFLRDWWFFLVALLMWNISGALAAGSPFPLHLDFMYYLDARLFLGHQPAEALQARLFAGHLTWLDVAASMVYNLHVAEPYIFGYALWRLNRAVYFQFCAAMLTLLVAGFITFVIFPAVPPWMAARNFGRIQGTENLFGLVLKSHPLPLRAVGIGVLLHLPGDRVAAFPSEHAALPMLELLTFTRVNRRFLPPFVAWLGIVAFVVVYLGQHWVTDIVAGWIYAIAAFSLVMYATRGPARHGSCAVEGQSSTGRTSDNDQRQPEARGAGG